MVALGALTGACPGVPPSLARPHRWAFFLGYTGGPPTKWKLQPLPIAAVRSASDWDEKSQPRAGFFLGRSPRLPVEMIASHRACARRALLGVCSARIARTKGATRAHSD